jgi:general secretion pathway protein M
MIPPSLQAPLARRLLFVVGNLAVGVAITFGIVVPVSELFGDRDREILHTRAAIARLRAVAVREVQPTAKKIDVGDGEFLTGKTDGVIGAELQARLQGIAGAAGAKVRSIRSLQPKTDGQTRYVGSHIDMLGPIAAIHRAIHAIEIAKPYLFVTSGVIRLAPTVGGQAGTPQAPLIEAQLEIFGVMRIEAREQ